MSALGHKQTFAPQKAMSALGQKQTYAAQQAMSALPPKATSIAFFGIPRWVGSTRPGTDFNCAGRGNLHAVELPSRRQSSES
jgi:hypothetical protein